MCVLRLYRSVPGGVEGLVCLHYCTGCSGGIAGGATHPVYAYIRLNSLRWLNLRCELHNTDFVVQLKYDVCISCEL